MDTGGGEEERGRGKVGFDVEVEEARRVEVFVRFCGLLVAVTVSLHILDIYRRQSFFTSFC